MTTRCIMYDIIMTTRCVMSEVLVDGIILIAMGGEILEEECGFKCFRSSITDEIRMDTCQKMQKKRYFKISLYAALNNINTKQSQNRRKSVTILHRIISNR